MNLFSRGIRNAFRNVIRTSSIIIILALSIGLSIAMLAAKQAVQDKIATVKQSVGNTVNISPAGFRGFEGGGTALTSDQLAKVSKVSHVISVTQMLSDRLDSNTTNLQSAIEAGQLGQRFGPGSSDTQPQLPTTDSSSSSPGTGTNTITRSFTPPVTITGTNNLSTTAAFNGNSAKITSGATINASSDENVALVGKALAEKNNLSVGSTFTAYNTTITVKGIYDTGTTFGNGGVVVPLATLQRLSSQSGAVTSATATIDSLDNLATATTAIKSALGSDADVSNSQDVASQTVEPLESVKKISVFSLVGAVAAGAVIILLTMMMIVRERKREIGVMKAIGASNAKIMGQFIVEALTLTILGLLVGTLVGIAAASPITKTLVTNSTTSSQSQQFGGGPMGAPGSNAGSRPVGGPAFRSIQQTSRQTLQNISASVGGSTLALGAGLAMLIAILGSAVPAYIISTIKPAEAMRSE
ncbi:ABC transporter permease [Candidatus Saccharibacteria bacterium]|nr:ABC transporter permease [Candidatus Saccharibacteria bacterium]